MPSNQESAGGGKAAKFVAANPLGPMADPFAGMVSTSYVVWSLRMLPVHEVSLFYEMFQLMIR